MPDKKISDFTTTTTPQGNDWLPLARPGNPADNFKVSVADFKTSLAIATTFPGGAIIGTASVSPNVLGTGNTTSDTFLTGNRTYVPVVQSITSPDNSITIVGNFSTTYTGNVTVAATKAITPPGSPSVSSTGVSRFSLPEFIVDSNSTVSIGSVDGSKLTGKIDLSDASPATSITTGAIRVVGGISTLDNIHARGIVRASQYASVRQAINVTTTTQTIDFNNGSYIELNVSAATSNVTLTFLNPFIATYLIDLIQGSTARDLIFPNGTLQGGGGGATYVGGASRRDLIAMTFTGSIYLINGAPGYA